MLPMTLKKRLHLEWKKLEASNAHRSCITQEATSGQDLETLDFLHHVLQSDKVSEKPLAKNMSLILGERFFGLRCSGW